MLYTILKAFIMPPGGIILLLLLAFLLVRGVLGRLILFVAMVTLGLMSLPVATGKLMEGLETYPAIAPGGPVPGDVQAILILGAGTKTWAPEYGGETLDHVSLVRVRYGARLHRATGLPVYVTGGTPSGEFQPVSRLMAQALADDYGIQVAGVEDESRTTWENATLSADMLRAHGVGKVLLVTDAWHLPRAMEAFHHAGVQAVAAPTGFLKGPNPGVVATLSDVLPSMKALTNSYYAIHEYLGRAWYQVREAAGEPDGAPVAG